MINSFIKQSKSFGSIFSCILLFIVAHYLQSKGGLILPEWCIAGLATACGVMLFGYVLQLNLLNRIGGIVLLLIAGACLVGMLLPADTIGEVPRAASQSMTRDFDTAWKAVYGKDLFEQFSLHQNLMQYTQSLSSFDIHRAGQMGMFALFGVAMGICFLFPIDPSHKGSVRRTCVIIDCFRHFLVASAGVAPDPVGNTSSQFLRIP